VKFGLQVNFKLALNLGQLIAHRKTVFGRHFWANCVFPGYVLNVVGSRLKFMEHGVKSLSVSVLHEKIFLIDVEEQGKQNKFKFVLSYMSYSIVL
jgi:hypothetical protein